MGKRTKKNGGRQPPKIARQGWLEENQNGMKIGSSAKGWLEEDQRGKTIGSDAKGWLIEDAPMEPPPKIFKLNIDCMDEIFEYLLLRDLQSFGQTCKTMLTVTGEYFKRNHSNAQLIMDGDRSYVYINGEYPRLPAYHQLISKIHFEAYNQEPLQYMETHTNEFEAIKHLQLVEHQVNERVANAIGSIFSKLETIDLAYVIVRENFYDIMLKQCTNLKRLHLDDLRYEFEHHQEIPGSWIKQSYPKLEHLKLKPITSINGLKEFFANNPGVRSFSTDSDSILNHKDELLKFNVQLDSLAVTDVRRDNLATLRRLLDLLHGQGFYKCLEIHNNQIDENSAVELDSLHGLDRLNISFYHNNDGQYLSLMPNLPNLKVMLFRDHIRNSNLRVIATKCPNLERILIYDTKHDDILSFVQRMPKLKKLRLLFTSNNPEPMKILNLHTLNTEREKLAGAQKLMIYVPDNIYVKTKWNVGNGNINLPLIEMKRIGSCKWTDCDFRFDLL